MPHLIRAGKRTRQSYSKIKEVLAMPNLIDIQRKSYKWFVQEGLTEVFEDISPIEDYTGNLILEFVDYYLDGKSKYCVDESKERDVNYATPLKAKVRLINKETGEVKEQEVFMGDFPLMTETGTFIINGAERVVVSQLVRSPGVYYARTIDKTGKPLYSATVIPNRGAWLEYETDSNGIVYVRIDRTRKLPVTVLLRALGYGTDQQIIDLIGEDERILATIEKDNTTTAAEGLLEIYKRLRPGEPLLVPNARSLFNSLFFDARRYDLAKVGRYKFNKKLSIASRIIGKKAAVDVVDKETGEIVVEAGQKITRELALKAKNLGINEVNIFADEEKVVKIVGNHFVDIRQHLDFDIEGLKVKKEAYFPTLKDILDESNNGEDLKKMLKEKRRELSSKHIIIADIVASINYLFNLTHEIGNVDDIDHLGNRRLRSVGELLQNQFRIGLSRMERVVKERMTIQDPDVVTPQQLINIRPLVASIKEFFGSSQLSQFMDQPNPLAELTHKRRLSALGPGGLSRERAGFEVRDVHHSHYGRMCPIETPEGPNIGLINSLSTYARVNEYGFIEAPYRKTDRINNIVTSEIEYLSADEEDVFIIVQANEPIDETGKFKNERVSARTYFGGIDIVPASEADYVDVLPKQIVSVATAMIPFLENDDANRALMGANMQRQAVPLLITDAPIVGTGMEAKAARDSGAVVLSEIEGIVERVTADEILIKNDNNETKRQKLRKFKRSNQGTCINQRALVSKGDRVEKNEVIADGASTEQGEIALGRNCLVGLMSWEGYNFEDAILISEKLVKEDSLTSIHIEEYESESRDTKLGPEEITRDIPNVSEEALKNLDERGVIYAGAEVKSGDILVGKVTPKGETELTAEERLLRAIFGEKAREVRDTSLKVPHGESGIVVDVKIFTRENGDELLPGVNEMVRVYIAKKRKINTGDKMAGRHGNKGVISRILPEEDMPFLADGTPLEIVLNPLGVPSRMNIGQVLEVHLGLAAKALGFHVATPVFDGASEKDVGNALEEAGYPRSGKLTLYDGRTGEAFDNDVTVGYMYMLKLHHLVDDKIHARSTGPYSLVTQQPLGGKAQFGGQRFGEMEVWALEAYGAAYTLQELLTVKSDDVVGRVKTYECVVKGENIPKPGIPESFKVLIKELQSLSLDVRLLNDKKEELDMKEVIEVENDGIEAKTLQGLISNENEYAQEVVSEDNADSSNLVVKQVVEDEAGPDLDDQDANLGLELGAR
ncbi:MAG: DNA-directed RNA polymerase subunit beta [Alkaliphilus sp.]